MAAINRARVVARVVLAALVLIAVPIDSQAYRQLTDTSGNNAKLKKQIYKVYIADDAAHPGRRAEVVAAFEKWKSALAPYGVTLSLQTGDPPKTVIDNKKYIEQQKKYNKDPATSPDMTKYPEIQKSFDKANTLSVYFKTTAEITAAGGGGAEKGLLNWFFDGSGKTIDLADMYLPSDPPGGPEDVKKLMLHNIAMHEFGHFGGFNHYTKAQRKTGQVMEVDATLFTTRLNLGTEETKGLKALYNVTPRARVGSGATRRSTSELPADVQSTIPDGLAHVWQYDYEVAWTEGEALSFFQVEIGEAPIFFAAGFDLTDDWGFEVFRDDEFNEFNGWNRFYEAASMREHFDEITGVGDLIEFFADENYIGGDFSLGSFTFLSDWAPGTGRLFTAAGTTFGVVPSEVPEPGTLALFGLGLASLGMRRRREAA